MQREPILVGVDRDGPQPQFGSRPEHARGDLTPVGNEQFAHEFSERTTTERPTIRGTETAGGIVGGATDFARSRTRRRRVRAGFRRPICGAAALPTRARAALRPTSQSPSPNVPAVPVETTASSDTRDY